MQVKNLILIITSLLSGILLSKLIDKVNNHLHLKEYGPVTTIIFNGDEEVIPAIGGYLIVEDWNSTMDTVYVGTASLPDSLN